MTGRRLWRASGVWFQNGKADPAKRPNPTPARLACSSDESRLLVGEARLEGRSPRCRFFAAAGGPSLLSSCSRAQGRPPLPRGPAPERRGRGPAPKCWSMGFHQGRRKGGGPCRTRYSRFAGVEGRAEISPFWFEAGAETPVVVQDAKVLVVARATKNARSMVRSRWRGKSPSPGSSFRVREP